MGYVGVGFGIIMVYSRFLTGVVWALTYLGAVGMDVGLGCLARPSLLAAGVVASVGLTSGVLVVVVDGFFPVCGESTCDCGHVVTAADGDMSWPVYICNWMIDNH